MAYVQGNTGRWEYVIGLEVHARVASKAKLFSASSTEFGSGPNTQVSLVDAAMPGMLPVLNEYCVEQAVKSGLGINGKINKLSVFDRKNYFYPDLPQGYQITQFYFPIVESGYINLAKKDGSEKTIRINRIHLEQDAGKSMHDQSSEYTLIDLNRAGIALMEIVSEPDISSPEEAAEYVRKLRSILLYIGSCDGNMEEGSLRCDANVSVRKEGDPLGTRCEIKNLNSVRNIIRSIEFEAARQVELIESGGKVEQETRLFDAVACETRTMRTKEDAKDYRYFPDPDLLPVRISDELIEKLRGELPELPDAKIKRYVEALGLNRYDAEVIVADEEAAAYFEKACAAGNAKAIANWLCSEVFGKLNKHSVALRDCKVTPRMLQELVSMVADEVISGKIAKKVFEIMFETGKAPQKIVEEEGLIQLVDTGLIESVIDEVLAENSDSVAAYKSGKEKLFGFFVGAVMKKTGGKANPSAVNAILKKKLS